MTADTAKPLDVAAANSRSADGFLPLMVGAVGVVFGDIGTSPLYAFREALAQAADGGITRPEIFGIVSLALWALLLVVTGKHILFLMSAANEGEGGVLALMVLALGRAPSRMTAILALGALGAALFFADGMITPAVSVLSALEGLRTVQHVAPVLTPHVIPAIAILILAGLFAIQSRGTAVVAALFGPVCLLWFVTIAGLGLRHILDAPAILAAIDPAYAVGFLSDHGVAALAVLGAVFLTITGAEALNADMGQFGVRPIRAGWFAIVLPALALNYLGQGAFAAARLAEATRQGHTLANREWFFEMAPEHLRVPLVILATLTTIIMSQAVITGTFSIARQAIQLGLLPRLAIRQTSEKRYGQVYLPLVNVVMFAGVACLIFYFRSSSAMASAYGLAVTGTMMVTTWLAFAVVRRRWKWRAGAAIALVLPFAVIDLTFFAANALKIAGGGWLPLLIAAALFTLIAVWMKGRRLLSELSRAGTLPLAELARKLREDPPQRVPGTAVYLSAIPELSPRALTNNLKHNKVLHERNVILTLRVTDSPYVDTAERLERQPIDGNFDRVTLSYGFMDQPHLSRDLGLDRSGSGFEPLATSFFLSRPMIVTSAAGMPPWQDILFGFLLRNANDRSDFLCIPYNRIVELGIQLEL